MIQKYPFIRELVESIAALCAPKKIYIFSMKYDLQHRVTGFKLCVVADTSDKRKLEQDIYLAIDCEIPYDVVVYASEEWEQFAGAEHTFAHTILSKGVLVYDQTA